MTGEGQRPTLRQTLGVFDGVAIVIGITIGAGIYSTPQIIAEYYSSFTGIVVSWIVAGAFVFVGGLIYAELGTRLPHTGGEYVYLNRAFGPFVGFIFGWAQLFIIRTSPAAGLSLVAADYAGYFVELREWQHTLLALTFIVILGVLNYLGIRWASAYQGFSSVVKIGGLSALVIVGVLLMGPQANLLGTEAPPTRGSGSLGSLSAAMILIVFSYLGWDRLGYVAGEMKNPKKVVPVSLLLSLSIIVVIYALTNMIYHGVLGMEGVRGSTIVASEAATHLVGPVGAGLIALLVIISTTGSVNGTMMTASRVLYAMARDGLFLRWFDYVHPRFRTPSRSVVAFCVWGAVILVVRRNFQNIVSGMTFAILIFFSLTTLALFKLRREQPGDGDEYRVPLYPFLPALYLLGITALIVVRGITEWRQSLIDLAFIATGIPVALVWLRKRQITQIGSENRSDP